MQHLHHPINQLIFWVASEKCCIFIRNPQRKGRKCFFDSELRKKISTSELEEQFSVAPPSGMLNHFGSMIILLLWFIWRRWCIISISMECIINQIIFLVITIVAIIIILAIVLTIRLLSTRWRMSQLSIWTTSGMICCRIMRKYRATIIGRVFLSVKNWKYYQESTDRYKTERSVDIWHWTLRRLNGTDSFFHIGFDRCRFIWRLSDNVISVTSITVKIICYFRSTVGFSVQNWPTWRRR